METQEVLDFHIPTAFKAGDKVKIVRKTERANAWFSEWTPGMNGMVGLDQQRVVQVDPLFGVYIGPSKGGAGPVAWFPSCALELAAPAGPIIIAVQSAEGLSALIGGRRKRTKEEIADDFAKQGLQSDGTPPAPVTKKPRAIKAGPWDAAPCTHLRWHMMGFYNEKLRLTVTKVKTSTGMDLGEEVGGEANLTFACTKCDKSVVMVAPIKVTK